jgi:putative oxidoreductase
MNRPLPPVLARACALACRLGDGVERHLAPLFNLALRLYLAEVFLRAGWLKISDWPATLQLFDYVYQVPLLPPHLAAVMGTAGELLLPLLLVAGLAGRFAAAGLSVVNATAAISFPEISDLGLQDHVLWGCMLLMLLCHGPGRWSLDAWRRRRRTQACASGGVGCPTD